MIKFIYIQKYKTKKRKKLYYLKLDYFILNSGKVTLGTNLSYSKMLKYIIYFQNW